MTDLYSICFYGLVGDYCSQDCQKYIEPYEQNLRACNIGGNNVNNDYVKILVETCFESDNTSGGSNLNEGNENVDGCPGYTLYLDTTLNTLRFSRNSFVRSVNDTTVESSYNYKNDICNVPLMTECPNKLLESQFNMYDVNKNKKLERGEFRNIFSQPEMLDNSRRELVPTFDDSDVYSLFEEMTEDEGFDLVYAVFDTFYNNEEMGQDNICSDILRSYVAEGMQQLERGECSSYNTTYNTLTIPNPLLDDPGNNNESSDDLFSQVFSEEN
eukprot:UN23436